MPAYIEVAATYLPNAAGPFDEFHMIAYTSHAFHLTQRAEQNRTLEFKGLRLTLLRDRSTLCRKRRAELLQLFKHVTMKLTARAWRYREHLREILDHKQVNVVRDLLRQWCPNVMRSKV